MDRIVKITDDKVVVGTTNGGLIEVNRDEVAFTISIGDEVEVFKNDNMIVISKPISKPDISASNLEQKNTYIDQNGNSTTLKDPVGQDRRKKVNKIAYGLLGIFLGGVGIHKFYAGRIGLGITYLLLFWTVVPFVIGFIEGIIGLTKDADQNGDILI